MGTPPRARGRECLLSTALRRGKARPSREGVDMSEIVSAGGVPTKKTSAKKRLVKTAKKLFASTGKAAWIVSTTFLVLVVPLIIETDREQQLVELENQQMGVLTKPRGGESPPNTHTHRTHAPFVP